MVGKCAALCSFHKDSPSAFNFDKDSLNCSIGEQTAATACDSRGNGMTFALKESVLLVDYGMYH